MSADVDTIVAVATPPGRGGIGIVRVSGPGVIAIAEALLGRLPVARHATVTAFRDADGEALDTGVALYFPAPRSYTGEDVLELQGHGGPVVLDAVVSRVLGLGARVARAGEFTERAFLNGRLDLAQAEAVADLIDSGTRAAAAGALRSLQGLFSSQVHQLVEALIEVRTLVEAALDFADEDIPLPHPEAIRARLDALGRGVADLRRNARQGVLLRDGMHVALAGAPNTGKSSLLNALARRDAAIVSDVPGTTRDPVRVDIDINGMPVHLVDTAGLRVSPDQIEAEGIRRATQAIERADLVLYVIQDSTDEFAPLPPELFNAAERVVTLRNKIDLTGSSPGLRATQPRREIAVSAHTGAGMDELEQYLVEHMGLRPAGEGTFMARQRHLQALATGAEAVAAARALLDTGADPELMAEELRAAQMALGEITGEFCADDLLGRIFSTFCLGK